MLLILSGSSGSCEVQITGSILPIYTYSFDSRKTLMKFSSMSSTKRCSMPVLSPNVHGTNTAGFPSIVKWFFPYSGISRLHGTLVLGSDGKF